MIDDQWIRRRGPKRPVALAVRYGGILDPPLRPAAWMRPTPVCRERKPLSDRPHAGNQPADIRLINRRNEVRRDRSPWPSPGGSLPNDQRSYQKTRCEMPQALALPRRDGLGVETTRDRLHPKTDSQNWRRRGLDRSNHIRVGRVSVRRGPPGLLRPSVGPLRHARSASRCPCSQRSRPGRASWRNSVATAGRDGSP